MHKQSQTLAAKASLLACSALGPSACAHTVIDSGSKRDMLWRQPPEVWQSDSLQSQSA